MKWLWLRRKAKRDRSKDWDRHYRVAQRLLMRLEAAADEGDVDRAKILLSRIRKVRDIQISDFDG